MKLSIALLLFFTFQVSAKSNAQEITIIKNNVSLSEVFKIIEKQSGYHFFYDKNQIEKIEPIDVSIKKATLNRALFVCLKGQHLIYTIVKNTIVIRPDNKATKFQSQPNLTSIETTEPPPIEIHGRVVDQQGKPLPNISVMIAGTKIGTTTNSDGRFTLTAPNNKNIKLEISSVGYQTKKIKVTGQGEINVTLELEVTGLSDVVVVAYGTQNKASYTGSLTTLNPETFENAPKENVLQSMQGNLPGVMVSSGSGDPNSVGNVRIRGLGSINAGRGPLYVVDGIPSSVSVTGLSPDDIESLTVLKDAAATSIYGSRAANGVVIITTKKGHTGKTKFNFSVMQGINKMAVTKRQRPLNTTEMLELLHEGWVNAGHDPTDWDAKVKSEGVDPSVNTDWENALYRTGHFSKYHLAASGGSDNTQFYLSGGYTKSLAPQIRANYQRGNVSMSVNTQVRKRLKLSGKVFGYFTKGNSVSTGGSFSSPIRAFYRTQPWIPIFNPDGSYNTGYNGTHNTVGELKLNSRPHTAFHATAQGKAIYEIIDGLTFESTESISLRFDKDATWYNPDFGSGRHNGGRKSVSTSYGKTWTTTNLLRYKHAFDGIHTLEVFGGYEAQKGYSEGLSGEGEDFIPGLRWLNAASLPKDLSSSNSSNALVGSFINAHYDYKGSYFLSASFRRDGSSRFGAQERYGNFWSVGAGWNLHKTIFRGVSTISDMKLRVSYGTNGNQDISNTAARGLYSSGHNYEGSSGALLGQYANAFLTWELNKPFDVGLDFSFFHNRLYGSVDFYNRITSQLLLNVPLLHTTGLGSYLDNYGSMKNTGWEFVLGSKNIVSSDPNGFTWNTDFNISANKNEITRLPSPLTSSTYKREVGYNYYNFYLYNYAGVDPETGEALWYSSEDKSSTTNDFSKAVRIVEGSATPKFYGGLTNTLTYKHFSFSFMLYFKWGGKVYDTWGHDTNTDGHKKFDAMGKMSRYEYENRWQNSGDHTDVPKIIYGNKTHSYDQSSRFLYDGSYIRLRDITLSYSLPSSFAHSLKINGASVYFRANNLLTYVKDKALIMDPEVYADGQLDQYAPNYKTITAGIDIKF